MKDYSELSTSDKLLAILCCVKEPTSINLALDLGGIENLSESEIKSVLESDSIETIDNENFEKQIWVKKNLQAITLDSLDVEPSSVHRKISEKLWEDMFGGLQ